MKKITLITLIQLLIGSVSLHATIYYVKPEGSGNGTSWSDAASSIHDMISKAKVGDAIWVSAGTYYPTKPINGDRSKSFVLKDGVHLYGGFSGNEATINDRAKSDRDGNGIVDPWEFTHETILSGNVDGVEDVWEKQYINASWTWNIKGYEGNSIHVVYCEDEFVNETQFDGFTVTGGSEYMATGYLRGGGIYAQGKIVINNCNVVKNYASRGGGGISNRYGTVSNSNISNNKTQTDGGGIWNIGTVINCVISNNSAITDGGGMYNGSSGKVINSVVHSNATYRSTIKMEAMESFGGGICNRVGVIENCIVFDNIVNAESPYGFPVRVYGGGIYNFEGVVSNCCVYNNYVYGVSDANKGGGICSSGSTERQAYVYCSTVVNNQPNEIDLFDSSSKAYYYNCISASSDLERNFQHPTSFVGIPQTDEQRIELLQADWRLKTGSEYIDNGSIANLPESVVNGTDLAGNTRIYNGKIDLGAYEYDSNGSSIIEPNRDMNICFVDKLGYLHFLLPENTPNIQLWTMNGTLIYQDLSVDNPLKLPQHGIYLVKIRWNNQVLTKKIVW